MRIFNLEKFLPKRFVIPACLAVLLVALSTGAFADVCETPTTTQPPPTTTTTTTTMKPVVVTNLTPGATGEVIVAVGETVKFKAECFVRPAVTTTTSTTTTTRRGCPLPTTTSTTTTLPFHTLHFTKPTHDDDPAVTLPSPTHDTTLTMEWTPSIPGHYSVRAVCDPHGNDEMSLWVVGVKNIQIEAGGAQNVDGGEKEVFLKGTKYTFKAIKDPESAPDWPPGYPDWSSSFWGMSREDNGEETTVTFTGQYDDRYLTAICGGSSKTAIMDVIVPEIRCLKFTGYDIYDKNDWWGTDESAPQGARTGDNVGCSKKGTSTSADVTFTLSKPLTIPTDVEIRGDVNWLDEYITGEDYGRDQMSIGQVLSTTASAESEAVAEAAVKDDYDVDIAWRYQVPAPNGTDEWIDAGNTDDLTYFLVWDSPTAPQENPWFEVLSKSVAWAEGATSPEQAASDVTQHIYDSGFAYANATGAPTFWAVGDRFDLTNCLMHWGAASVNCWDAAQMVAVFGNALGCNMTTCYIEKTDQTIFLLNFIKPIGLSWTNDPFTASGRDGFSCHWTGQRGGIYDACLQVDSDGDPTASPHTGELPIDMIFDSGMPVTLYDDYRGKLVDPVDELSVIGRQVDPAGIWHP